MCLYIYIYTHTHTHTYIYACLGFPGGSDGKDSTCNAGDLGWKDPLEKGRATHSCILAWGIPWTI